MIQIQIQSNDVFRQLRSVSPCTSFVLHGEFWSVMRLPRMKIELCRVASFSISWRIGFLELRVWSNLTFFSDLNVQIRLEVSATERVVISLEWKILIILGMNYFMLIFYIMIIFYFMLIISWRQYSHCRHEHFTTNSTHVSMNHRVIKLWLLREDLIKL